MFTKMLKFFEKFSSHSIISLCVVIFRVKNVYIFFSSRKIVCQLIAKQSHICGIKGGKKSEIGADVCSKINKENDTKETREENIEIINHSQMKIHFFSSMASLFSNWKVIRRSGQLKSISHAFLFTPLQNVLCFLKETRWKKRGEIEIQFRFEWFNEKFPWKLFND